MASHSYTVNIPGPAAYPPASRQPVNPQTMPVPYPVNPNTLPIDDSTNGFSKRPRVNLPIRSSVKVQLTPLAPHLRGSIPQNTPYRTPGPPNVRPQRVFAARPSAQEQASYLDYLAFEEIPKADISTKELAEKEALRLSLETTCQIIVARYEKNDEFVADGVRLKCFGSLSTTFATKSSDMDLVLLSSMSKPNLSSSESEIPRLIEKALLDLGFGARLLTKTRVPIIKFCEKPTPELAALLLAERLKYEKEQDTAPKTDVEKGDATLEAKATMTPKEPVIVRKDGQAAHSMEAERDDPHRRQYSHGERARLYRLAMQEGWYEPADRGVINRFISIVENSDRLRMRGMANVLDQRLHDALVCLQYLPNVIARYRPPPAHSLDFPKIGVGIQCDINFSNYLALHNSLLLKCYSLCDPRVRKMVLFVKAWAKKRKINSPYHGSLSSYGYVLMVLHYLVNIASPPVVPNLQKNRNAFSDEVSTKEVELDGHDIRFFRNEAAIMDIQQRQAMTTNKETIGSLLRGFFHYFAQQEGSAPDGGFRWIQYVLSLRSQGGLLTKHGKGWTGARTEKTETMGPDPQTKHVRQRYLLAIEDPFEIEHNIARTVAHGGIVAIRDEFRRAHWLIQNLGRDGRRSEHLFAEAEDKSNLQYRAFGPQSRKGPQAPEGGKEGKDIHERKKDGLA